MTARPTERADDYWKGRLVRRQRRTELTFDVAHSLFSTARIDSGTELLLRWLAQDDVGPNQRVLDLGCGYGPLGLTLAALADDRTVTAVDRDLLAVDYTAWNAGQAGFGDRVTAKGSLGYDDLGDETFDLVVSNVPAKVGDRGLEHFVLGARRHLRPGGTAAFVVIDRLVESLDRLLEANPSVAVRWRHATRQYTALSVAFDTVGTAAGSPRVAGGLDVYRRAPGNFSYGGRSWTAEPVHTLDEFDTLGFDTRLAMQVLTDARATGSLADLSPGQGHLATWALTAPANPGSGVSLSSVLLAGRDLLSLRAAEDMLLRNGADRAAVRVEAAARPYEVDLDDIDWAVLRLPDDMPVSAMGRVVGRVVGRMAASSSLVVTGRSADVSRVLELARVGRSGGPRSGSRERFKGHSAAVVDIATRRG